MAMTIIAQLHRHILWLYSKQCLWVQLRWETVQQKTGLLGSLGRSMEKLRGEKGRGRNSLFKRKTAEAQLIVPDWGIKPAFSQGCRTGPPATQAGGPVRQPYVIVDFSSQSGTMNLATERHKVRKYKEYHSVCPLVGIGTLPTPLSSASVPLPQNRERGGGRAHFPAGEGFGESQFRRLEKKLSTLHTLC